MRVKVRGVLNKLFFQEMQKSTTFLSISFINNTITYRRLCKLCQSIDILHLEAIGTENFLQIITPFSCLCVAGWLRVQIVKTTVIT